MAKDPNVITFFRGDTYPRAFTITDGGAPVDLTDCTAVMTVATVEEPVDDTTKLFQVSGVLNADPKTGLVSFTPTAANNGVVGEYFYDIQITTVNGHIRTPIKSTYIINQDITKV